MDVYINDVLIGYMDEIKLKPEDQDFSEIFGNRVYELQCSKLEITREEYLRIKREKERHMRYLNRNDKKRVG